MAPPSFHFPSGQFGIRMFRERTSVEINFSPRQTRIRLVAVFGPTALLKEPRSNRRGIERFFKSPSSTRSNKGTDLRRRMRIPTGTPYVLPATERLNSISWRCCSIAKKSSLLHNTQKRSPCTPFPSFGAANNHPRLNPMLHPPPFSILHAIKPLLRFSSPLSVAPPDLRDEMGSS